jgi:hypothetical protein
MPVPVPTSRILCPPRGGIGARYKGSMMPKIETVLFQFVVG